MNLDEDKNIAEEEEQQPSSGFGELLSQAREQAGYSQQDVAVELHLKPELIQAIDDEKLDELPEPAYVRGYLRSYARMVSVDVETVLNAYSSLNHETPEWEFNEPARHEVAQGRKLTPVTIIVFVITLGLLVTWLLTEGNGGMNEADVVAEAPAPEPEPLQEPVPVAVETPESTADPESFPPNELSAEAEPALAEEALVQEDSLTLEEEPVEEVAIVEDGLDNFELASVQADGTDSVVLRFNQESWAEVFDANGVQLLRGLMKSGTVQQLSGTAPFSVFLGNTPAVEISINDVEFDASPFMRRDSVSRFTLKAP
ncbi:MAG: DUF4115 domain-containing protein [Gammaproteobacteria bacterium]|nr:DUF4115 domain-containing protein [Gammaproteobacteria bacterium]